MLSLDFLKWRMRPAHVPPDSKLTHPEDVHALTQLGTLLRIPGALKIITGEPDRHGHPLTRDVTHIEGPNREGEWTAWAQNPSRCHLRDNAFTRGTPVALLGQLTKANRLGERLHHPMPAADGQATFRMLPAMMVGHDRHGRVISGGPNA